MPIHLHPTAELAPRALLPGDPGRALALAQLLLDAPRMFNHARGLWGYTGTAADGEPLTIQSTGIGGPSTAAVLEDLAALGLRVALRAGTCHGADATTLGSVVTVAGAHGLDGVSTAAGVVEVRPDPEFAGDAVVSSRDRFEPGEALTTAFADRTTAPFLVVARELGLRCGAVLAVTSTGGLPPLEGDALLAAETALGHASATLLGLPARVAAV